MVERLTEIFISDVCVGDTIHFFDGTLRVENIIPFDPDGWDMPTEWWELGGRGEDNRRRRYRFEGSEVVWCLRETGA